MLEWPLPWQKRIIANDMPSLRCRGESAVSLTPTDSEGPDSFMGSVSDLLLLSGGLPGASVKARSLAALQKSAVAVLCCMLHVLCLM
jgi:hypothetical protein